MKPLSIKNGLQFLSPEQQALAMIPMCRPMTMNELAEVTDLAPSTAYNNSNVLSALGVFRKISYGTGSGEAATYQPAHTKHSRLLDLHRDRAPILECSREELRILYVCSTEEQETRSVLESQIGKRFTLRDYVREAQREYRQVLLEHADIETPRGILSGCQLTEAGFRMLGAWRLATAIIHPTIH